METENEYQGMRDLFRRAPVRTAPVGLEKKIMNGILKFDGKRRRQRQAVTSWLRFVAIGFVVILLTRAIGSGLNLNFSGRLTADGVADWAGKSGDAGRWLADHCYYLLPLALLFVRRRVRDHPT